MSYASLSENMSRQYRISSDTAQEMAESKVSQGKKKKKSFKEVIPVFVNADYDFKINPPRR